jgi:hypothetical protein
MACLTLYDAKKFSHETLKIAPKLGKAKAGKSLVESAQTKKFSITLNSIYGNRLVSFCVGLLKMAKKKSGCNLNNKGRNGLDKSL